MLVQTACSGKEFTQVVFRQLFTTESDVYVKNYKVHSNKHAMFLSNIVTGKSQKLKKASNGRTSPDAGYDSVQAVTKANGGAVKYPETIVYRAEAVIPSVVLIYTRTGWKPH